MWILWSDWADAQVDLCLRWAHSHIVGFVMSPLIFASPVCSEMGLKWGWIISIFHGYEVWTEICISRINGWHHKALPKLHATIYLFIYCCKEIIHVLDVGLCHWLTKSCTCKLTIYLNRGTGKLFLHTIIWVTCVAVQSDQRHYYPKDFQKSLQLEWTANHR